MSNRSSIGSSQTLDPRLRAICDLSVPAVRQDAGRHEYDGLVQDLSPTGIEAGLRALEAVTADAYRDPYDEALSTAATRALRVRFGELELHRVNPLVHIENLGVTCYVRPYAAEGERRAARLQHLRLWPDAVAGAIESLDRVPALVARGTLPLARQLRSDLVGVDEEVSGPSGQALDRLVAHLEGTAIRGDPSAALGTSILGRLLSASESAEVDVEALWREADAERQRMRALLDEACQRIDPTASTAQTVAALQADHPRADGLLAEATELTAEVIAWTVERDLVPYGDGECLVERMPGSLSGPAAMISAVPYERDAPASFYVNPPDPAWTEHEQEQWLRVYFSRAFLPAIVVHEVAPGHFSHGRALRRSPGDVRRTLLFDSFAEGWAVYCEELALEEGFRAGDPRFAAGVALSALERAVRMLCVIGLHAGAMAEREVDLKFRQDAFFDGPAARAAVQRCYYVPTWIRYTWGKLAIRDLRARAQAAWGPAFSLQRFHTALLDLGSPPLGLLGTAVERG